MNNTIKKQLNHRTIREFKEERIPEDVFNTLMEVARQTASSVGLQSYSIIRVTDPKIKMEIANICNQEYVARAPELLIFVADQFRNRTIANEKENTEVESVSMDFFFQAITDTCLGAQNVVNAAESMDLGTVYLGSVLNDIEKLVEVLNLPKFTFPVLGLGIGYPNQDPQLKPRMSMDLRVFENQYKVFDNYLQEIKDYDEEMQTYYDLRDANNRVDSFSNQVVARLKSSNPKREAMLNIAKKQGFDLGLKE